MYWLEISVETDGEGAEAVADALRPFALDGGVALEQMGDETDLDPNALESIVTVKIYVSEADDTPELRRRIEEIMYHLGRLYPLPSPKFTKLEDADWANAWKEHYKPFRVGRKLWIQPSWIPVDATSESGREIRLGDVVIVLDPGMAFGTGSHPTTQMCLLALEKLVEPGTRILDVGTGSAILAIAAAKLGAAELLGVDNDEVAVKAARDNVTQNQADEKVRIEIGTLATVTAKNWDIVVVNILAPVIIALLRDGGLLEYVAPGGQLVLSGILDQQLSQIEEAIDFAGGSLVETLHMGDWVACVVQPGR